MSELESFRRIAGDNPFRAWLESQRDESVKYLVNAVDPVAVHRAQGQFVIPISIATFARNRRTSIPIRYIPRFDIVLHWMRSFVRQHDSIHQFLETLESNIGRISHQPATL